MLFALHSTINPYVHMRSENAVSLWLLDDDQDDGDLLASAISEACPHVRYRYYSMADALFQALKTKRPWYLLVDRKMPIPGIECLKKIRADDPHLCLISYSDSSRKADIEECYARGANLYVVKPSAFYHLKKAVALIVDSQWKDAEHHHHYIHEGEFKTLRPLAS